MNTPCASIPRDKFLSHDSSVNACDKYCTASGTRRSPRYVRRYSIQLACAALAAESIRSRDPTRASGPSIRGSQ